MFKTINGWTKQAMIDQIAKMVTFKSIKQIPNMHGESCSYRGEQRTVCAVGAFIPDELYQEEMDIPSATEYVRVGANGTGADMLLEAFPELAESMPLATDGLIKMQQAHDECEKGELVTRHLIDWVNANVEES